MKARAFVSSPALAALFLWGLLLPGTAAAVDAPKPWRLSEEAGLPWLTFSLEERLRFEHLNRDFRADHPEASTGLFSRALFAGEARWSPVVVGLELADSRAWLDDSTPANTGLSNPLDVLRAYAGLRFEGLFVPEDRAALTVGRMTLDLGSRRLLARNEFRNTINAFTGVDAEWTSPERDVLRLLAVLPVVRLPSGAEDLADGKLEFDRENTGTLLAGAFAASRPLPFDVVLEAYVLTLFEDDVDIAPSTNRRLFTPGLRAWRAPAVGQWDFQFEPMVQFGTSRASTDPMDATDLEHRAFALHASVGHRFDVWATPRLLALYDYASGDVAADDESQERFDPLFAARRSEFGPTGTYGAFARSNLSSPGLRLEVQPHPLVDGFVGHRAFWLASDRDAWTTAGVRDPSGASGSFLGNQVEGRVRFNPWPKNLGIEIGAAWLVRGRFARTAPGAPDADPVFFYTQLTGAI